ncbi:putative salutaridinol 7-O-acetyltransferase-like [Capsicum annuum]|nr:putative salutaridinol 7-O-acetyltransferase-like [Capsicum annuum]
MANSDIQIQLRKMVKPSTRTPNHLRSLKLSLFDQVAPHVFVPILFHYLPNSECNMEGIAHQRCDKLQKSLAQTLTRFYPLAGRFSKDDLSINCSDEGVEYVESKVNGDLAEFLHQGLKVELLNNFLPTDMPSSLLLRVQVNEWAHITQTGTTKGCLPSFGHLPLLFPARVLSGPQVSPPSDTGPKIVTKRGKSNMPSLEHALGNLYVTVAASLEANKLRKELNDFVNVVGSTTRDTSASIGKASIDDLTSMFVIYGTEVANKLGLGDEIDIYPSTSWCRFPWYEADFGWGNPFWVSSVSKPFQVIILNDTKDGDGIEAWVSLKENDMAEFETDPDILSTTSKVEFDTSMWIK